jgi:hypothetical protein
MANVRVLQTGAAKPSGVWPYTICFIANPFLETGRSVTPFIRDPVLDKEAEFDAKVSFIVDCIAGRLQGQAEKIFGPLVPDWRIVSIFDTSLASKPRNALVAQHITGMVEPRQKRFPPFLKAYDVHGMGKMRADVAFAITNSATHLRCSAQPTFDDDGASGRSFTLDDRQKTHRSKNKLPGAVAFHITAESLVPLHEFSHAASSRKNGVITDLYREAEGLNKRRGPRIPDVFCRYNGQIFRTTPDRGGGIAYPRGSDYYHSELADPAFPAVMDNYSMAGAQVRKCRHDKLTERYLLDRIQTIMAR